MLCRWRVDGIANHTGWSSSQVQWLQPGELQNVLMLLHTGHYVCVKLFHCEYVHEDRNGKYMEIVGLQQDLKVM